MSKVVKVCPQCGTPFFTQDNRKYCSDLCKNKAREMALESYYRVHKGICADFADGNNIYHKESDRKNLPTKEDLDDVKMLLRDFDIFVDDVPKFNSYGELDRWRRRQIVQALS